MDRERYRSDRDHRRRRHRSRSRDRDRRRRSKSRQRYRRDRSRDKRDRGRDRKREKDQKGPKPILPAPKVAGPPSIPSVRDRDPEFAKSEQTKLARRVYVGNIPVGQGLNAAILKNYFNGILKVNGLLTPNPVMDTWLSPNDAFAFITFRSVLDAALSLNLLRGEQLGGRPLRFGRTADYQPPPMELVNYCIGGGTHATVRTERGEFIHIIPPNELTQEIVDQLKGGIPTEVPLNQGGGFDPTGGAANPFSAIPLDLASIAGSDSQKKKAPQDTRSLMYDTEPEIIKGKPHPLLPDKILPDEYPHIDKYHPPSHVLRIQNMVGAEDLQLISASRTEMKKFKSDIADGFEDCKMEEMYIPKIKQNGAGNVYVVFPDIVNAKRAAESIHENEFDQRTVVAAYLNPNCLEYIKDDFKSYEEEGAPEVVPPLVPK